MHREIEAAFASIAHDRVDALVRTTTGVTAAAKEILTILDKAETSLTWNATLLAVREARQLLKNLPAL
jgi:hypothetical protein